MKKTTVILIILVLLSCSLGSALADEFILHSGVKFGMTIEDIRQIETNSGFDVENNEDNTELTISGKIASVEDSTITYTFHDNKMFQTKYSLGKDRIDRGIEGYRIIQQSLESKYGNPTGLPDGFHSSEFNNIISRIAPDGFLQEQGDIELSNEWLITTDTGYVIIEHIKYYYKFTKLFLDSGMNKNYPQGRTYNEAILYQFYDFNDPELNNAVNNALESIKQLENDL